MPQPKVGGNPERLLPICSPPFPAGTGTRDSGDPELDNAIRGVLFKLRHDLSANAVKTMEEVTSIRAPLELWLGPKEAPEVADLQPGETCQTGYFQGGGLQLRPLLGIYRVRASLSAHAPPAALSPLSRGLRRFAVPCCAVVCVGRRHRRRKGPHRVHHHGRPDAGAARGRAAVLQRPRGC
jgi:hypothetical protein